MLVIKIPFSLERKEKFEAGQWCKTPMQNEFLNRRLHYCIFKHMRYMLKVPVAATVFLSIKGLFSSNPDINNICEISFGDQLESSKRTKRKKSLEFSNMVIKSRYH